MTLKRVFAIKRTPLTLTNRREVSNALKTRKDHTTKGNMNEMRDDMYDLMTKSQTRALRKHLYGSTGTI
jgi:hypothetical protein